MVQTEPRVAPDDLQPVYHAVRSLTESLAAPLSAEDQTVQSMPDVSPTKWHRAHTSWFFETFVLTPSDRSFRVYDEHYDFLFNSYYETVGPRHARPERGLLSRPGIEEVAAYRRHVDEAMTGFLSTTTDPSALALSELGCHHEQQHQELIVMDIKHVLSRNPLHPGYLRGAPRVAATSRTPPTTQDTWLRHQGGLVEIGHGGGGFAFDNEGPRHIEYLLPYELAAGLVTNGQWFDFMADGGYERPQLWLSEGWACVNDRGWSSPLYWEQVDGRWCQYTLSGMREVDPSEPVCHVSLFEADAFARWAGARLPSEAEWEAIAAEESVGGHFLDPDVLHPRAQAVGSQTLFGDVWQWTSSAYSAYPGFRPPPGAVGEYNGKFMANQYVLRGGSCATPVGHVRATYRNFFPAAARWAFSGVRLARDG